MEKIIPKAMQETINDLYFGALHLIWLDHRGLNEKDRLLYFKSPSYQELRKMLMLLSGFWTYPQAEMFIDMDIHKANLALWTFLEKKGISVDTSGRVSRFLDRLRLETVEFNRSRKESRRAIFQRIKELTERSKLTGGQQ